MFFSGFFCDFERCGSDDNFKFFPAYRQAGLAAFNYEFNLSKNQRNEKAPYPKVVCRVGEHICPVTSSAESDS